MAKPTQDNLTDIVKMAAAEILKDCKTEGSKAGLYLAVQVMQFKKGYSPVSEGPAGEWLMQWGMIVHQPEPNWSEFGEAVMRALGHIKG